VALAGLERKIRIERQSEIVAVINLTGIIEESNMIIRPASVLLLVLTCSTALAQDMPLTQVLLPGQGWELVGSGYKFTEGPAVDDKGNVFFTDIPNNRIHRIDAVTGKVGVFATETARTNGLMFGSDGLLYGCRNGDRQVVAYAADASHTVIADNLPCNDLVVTSDGRLFVTDPANGKVWHIDDKRKKRVVAEGIHPNGVILWPGQGTLVVTERNEPHLWTYRVEADGSLSHRERYYLPLRMLPGRERPGSDGMTVDAAGRLYVTTYAGVQMFDPTGRMGGVIHKPQRGSLANVVFGGPRLDLMYVTAGDKVFRRKTKVRGAPYFLKPRAGSR